MFARSPGKFFLFVYIYGFDVSIFGGAKTGRVSESFALTATYVFYRKTLNLLVFYVLLSRKLCEAITNAAYILVYYIFSMYAATQNVAYR